MGRSYLTGRRNHVSGWTVYHKNRKAEKERLAKMTPAQIEWETSNRFGSPEKLYYLLIELQTEYKKIGMSLDAGQKKELARLRKLKKQAGR